MKLRYLATLGVAALTLAAVAAVALARPAQGVEDETARTVTVTGTGFIESVPDRARFSFGVTTQAKGAVAALSANSVAMRKVIDALKAAGIVAEDIQTQQVAISQRYDDEGEVVLGYEASNSVAVLVRRLGRAGAVIDAAVSAGANSVEGPALSRSNQGALARQALAAAVVDARSNAEAIARGAEATLGRVLTVSVDGATPPEPMSVRSAAKAADEAAPPIEAGTQTIQAVVSVTFELR